VYGAGQPTEYGIRAIIQLMVSRKSEVKSNLENYPRKVVWCNLREEPVIHINGRSFVLRSVDKPFEDISKYAGIDAERIQAMEFNLKKEILEKSSNYKGLLLIHDEVYKG
jgi:hypothetical protein